MPKPTYPVNASDVIDVTDYFRRAIGSKYLVYDTRVVSVNGRDLEWRLIAYPHGQHSCKPFRHDMVKFKSALQQVQPPNGKIGSVIELSTHPTHGEFAFFVQYAAR